MGTSDWAYWDQATLLRKATGGAQISDVTQVGSGGNYGTWADPSRTVTWSDGTPTASGSDDGYLWSNAALQTGFTMTVPADTTPRTVYVFYGASNATVTVSAHLSDGSAPDYSNSQMGPGAWLETITYQAGSDGQVLTLSVLKTGNNSGSTDGSADLVAVMLADGSAGGAGGSGSGGSGGSGGSPSGGSGTSSGGSSGTGRGKGEANCGLTGIDGVLPIGLLWLLRRRRKGVL
jgi:hypothetical protein